MGNIANHMESENGGWVLQIGNVKGKMMNCQFGGTQFTGKPNCSRFPLSWWGIQTWQTDSPTYFQYSSIALDYHPCLNDSSKHCQMLYHTSTIAKDTTQPYTTHSSTTGWFNRLTHKATSPFRLFSRTRHVLHPNFSGSKPCTLQWALWFASLV